MRIAITTACVYVFDQYRAGLCAVTCPKLAAIGPIIGCKEQAPGREFSWVATISAPVPGVYVFDRYRARICTVAFPKLYAVGPIISRKKQGPVHISESTGIAASITGPYVFDQYRAEICTIAFPELSAHGPIVGNEEKYPAHIRQFIRRTVTARVYILNKCRD